MNVLKRAAYPYNAINDKDFLVGNFGLRFHFNGQETDDEIAGKGNVNTAEYWEYDTRLGRRWNVDPITKPQESPYSAFANNPIWFIDPSGSDSTVYMLTQSKSPITGKEMEKYKNEVEKVFKNSGIDYLKFKIVTESEAKEIQLDRTDAMVLVTLWGPKNGSTEIHNDGSSGNIYSSYLNIDYATDQLKEVLKNGGHSTHEEMVGVLTAHEIWHQYISKAQYDVNGQVAYYDSSDPQKGHDNRRPNLNMDGDHLMAQVFKNPTNRNMSEFSKVLPYQRTLFERFLSRNSNTIKGLIYSNSNIRIFR